MSSPEEHPSEVNPYQAPASDAPPMPGEASPEVSGAELDNNSRMWGMFCHLSALSGYIGVPFGNILGPLVVWLIKKDEMPFVDYNGKEALNFNITVIIASLICIPLVFVLIGIFLLIALAIAALIFTIIAAIKTNNGEYYRYPMTIRFIK
jgi:hypothetical protein